MVKCCCVAGCNNKWGVTVGGKKVRFFKIPRCTGKQSNLRKHNEWVAAIDRGDWRPNAEDVVCGEHFLTGQPSHDPAHPDYRPQIFSNRHMDLQRLKKDLADWEKNKDKNPPVIQVQEKEVKHQKLILPKGYVHPLQYFLNQEQLKIAAAQPVATTSSTDTTSIRIEPLDNSQAQDLTTIKDTPDSDGSFMSTSKLKPKTVDDNENEPSVMSDIDKVETSAGTLTPTFSNGVASESSIASSELVSASDIKSELVDVKANGKTSPASSVSDIKIEPLNASLNQTNVSAAALMSALATTAGLGKSVGTGVDFSESNMNGHTGKKSKEDIKDVKVEELSESVISKAVIKTPVKIKSNGDDDSVRFMTQYMCRYCAHRFDSWTKMQEHVQGHLKGKHNNHTCSVCGKEYRTPSKLQRHVRVHSGERPYPCSVCGRRFTRSDHVKQHMKVHLPPQELNVCRLCGTRFMKRQSLQLHLQQAHLVNQLFTCNRCGEAFESLEQLNAHNLTHDAILNSMNSDGKSPHETTLQGLAKFSMGPAVKQVELPTKTSMKEKKSTAAVKPPPIVDDSQKYNYVLTLDAPENQEAITKISDKLIAESIEEESKKYEEIQRQIEEHAKLMAEETAKHEEELEKLRQQREKDEKIVAEKIASAFNIERSDDFNDSKEDDSMDISEYDSPSVLTSVDGTSMYISTSDILKMKEGTVQNDNNSDGSDSNINETEDSDMTEMKDDLEPNEQENDLNKDSKKTPHVVIAGHNKAYKPGPLWFKTAQEIHRNAILNQQSDKILNIPKVDSVAADSDLGKGTQPKMVSCIKPSINELLKAKVEQKNISVSEKDQNLTNAVSGFQRPVPIAPRQQIQQYILVSPPPQPNTAQMSQPNTSQLMPSTTQMVHQNLSQSGMLRCDHCCIWFEDRAMCLLHNTLHNADEADPFTCRKCYKKLGNRLEFMAHLVWHLEPNMDI